MLTVSDPIKKLLVRNKFLMEIGLAPHLTRDSEADSVIAVILLDYCVESLLKTVMTAAGVSPAKGGDPKFPDLWTLIEDKVVKDARFGISLAQLPFRVELANLHRQRNATQHESKTPHRTDVEKDVVIVREFASQVYREIFGMDYAALSLIDLVRNELIRKLLTEARSLHDAGDFFGSVSKSAEALTRMLRIADASGPKADVRLYDVTRGIKDRPTSDALEKIVKAMEKSQERTDRLMHIVMGLDYKGYARYRHYAPSVLILLSGEADTTFVNIDEIPLEESKYILDYVLANVLRMEEYGLEWKSL